MDLPPGLFVTGATGVVGSPLVSTLAAMRRTVYAVSRKRFDKKNDEFVRWIEMDLSAQNRLDPKFSADALIHAAPMWFLGSHLPMFIGRGVSRIVAFSSTSAVTKIDAKNTDERAIATRLREAEQEVKEICARHDVGLTIFRPTLIYGYGKDRNVTKIARFIKKFGFFAVAGAANGKRQPVHADDLVDAAIKAIKNQQSINRTYDLSGGEVLTYREMVSRIFVSLEIPVRIMSLPLSVYRAGLGLFAAVGLGAGWSSEIADRMNIDMCFSHEAAINDFGYRPGKFRFDANRDLP